MTDFNFGTTVTGTDDTQTDSAKNRGTAPLDISSVGTFRFAKSARARLNSGTGASAKAILYDTGSVADGSTDTGFAVTVLAVSDTVLLPVSRQLVEFTFSSENISSSTNVSCVIVSDTGGGNMGYSFDISIGGTDHTLTSDTSDGSVFTTPSSITNTNLTTGEFTIEFTVTDIDPNAAIEDGTTFTLVSPDEVVAFTPSAIEDGTTFTLLSPDELVTTLPTATEDPTKFTLVSSDEDAKIVLPQGGITSSDLLFKLSGGSTNTDPNSSLGGDISSTEIQGTVSSMWPEIGAAEAASGSLKYRSFYVDNTSAFEILTSKTALLNNVGGDVSYDYGLGLLNDNLAIANETTAPTEVVFTSGIGFANALTQKNILAADVFQVWMRRIVTSGATDFSTQLADIAFEAADELETVRTVFGSVQEFPDDFNNLLISEGISTGGGAAVWGGITGTLSDQTDLQTDLDSKLESVISDSTLSGAGTIASPLVVVSTVGEVTPDILVTGAYGQSNVFGFNSGGTITQNIDPSRNLMLATGLRSPSYATSPVPSGPFIAADASQTDFDEAGYVAMQNEMINQSSVLGSYSELANAKFVTVLGGRQALSIQVLGKPSTFYTEFLASLQAAKDAADLAGQTSECWNVIYNQHESNTADVPSGNDDGWMGYGLLLADMYDDINADVKSIFGQTRDVIMHVLTSSEFANSTFVPFNLVNHISIEVQSGADLRPGKILSACHTGEFVFSGDGTHYGLDGGVTKYGQRMAFSMLYQQRKPLRAASASFTGSTITILVEGGVGALQFNNTFVPDKSPAHNILVDDNGGSVTVNSVTLNGREITVNCAAPLVSPVDVSGFYTVPAATDGGQANPNIMDISDTETIQPTLAGGSTAPDMSRYLQAFNLTSI